MKKNRLMRTGIVQSSDVLMGIEKRAGWTTVATNHAPSYRYAIRMSGNTKQLILMARASEMKYQTEQNEHWLKKKRYDYPEVLDEDVLLVYLGSSDVRNIKGHNVVTIDVDHGVVTVSKVDRKFKDTVRAIKETVSGLVGTDEATAYALYNDTGSRKTGPLAVFIMAALILLLYNWFDDPAIYGLAPGETSFINYFTYLFSHSNAIHLFSNVAALIMAGLAYTSEQGTLGFILCFFSGGYISGMVSQVASSLSDAPYYTVGASGAIFALFTAYVTVTLIKKTATSSMITRIMLIVILSSIGTNIALACHIGGAVYGVIFGINWYYISKYYDLKRADSRKLEPRGEYEGNPVCSYALRTVKRGW